MSQQREVTPREALTRLGASTAEAIARVLEMFLPDGVERGDVTVLPEASSPFGNLTFGTVSASVSYVDGVTGGNVFVMTPAGARALAIAMGVPPEEDQEDNAPLSELEFSAIGEAANQMMAAAAAAIGVVLGQEIEISPPDTRVLEDTDAATDIYGTAPHATSVSFTVGGEPCRLIQLVPSAFVVRMVRAMDELAGESAFAEGGGADRGPDPAAGGADDESTSLTDALRDISLRVWAELGRSDMALGHAVELPFGSVVDLDRRAEAPIELYVNGLRFAYGELLVTDDGEWAFRVVRLTHPAPASSPLPALATLPT